MDRARQRGLPPLRDADHAPGRPPGALQGGCQRAAPLRLPEGCVFYEPRKVSQAGWQVRRKDEDRDPPGHGWALRGSGSTLEEVAQQVDGDALLA